MKRVPQFTVLCGMLLVALLGSAQVKMTRFLIDSTKDYAYLKFDHLGNRKRITSDEVSKGLWIRLVNNCRVPLLVATFNPGTGDSGVGVYDEVVPAAGKGPKLQLEGGKNAPSPPSMHTETIMPQGYSLPDVFSTTQIPPGESIVFSVPANQVGPSWSIQIRFYLAPSKEAYGTGPYSVLSFDWVDIPEQFRAAWEPEAVPGVTQEPKLSPSMLAHEPGHVAPPKQQ